MKIFIKHNKKIVEPEITILGDEDSQEVINVVELLESHVNNAKTCVGLLNERQHILDVNKIVYFESQEQQVIAYYENNEYLVKEKLYEIENKYSNFLRISKWCVVNMDLVSQVHSPFNMTVSIMFKNCKVSQVVTRKYLKIFRERILGK